VGRVAVNEHQASCEIGSRREQVGAREESQVGWTGAEEKKTAFSFSDKVGYIHISRQISEAESVSVASKCSNFPYPISFSFNTTRCKKKLGSAYNMSAGTVRRYAKCSRHISG
jgi:hypothetical protein